MQINETRITSWVSRIVTLIVCCAMTAGMGFLIFSLQPFGLRWPTFVGVAATLVVLQVGRRPRSLPRDSPPSNMRGPRQSIRVLGRRLLSALCLTWLCLIAWAEASPGRVLQPPPRQAEEIRVVTWNILRGRDGGPPWLRGDWSSRRPALATALEAVQPDILCVQEALPGQLCFLEQTLPNHHRAGVGRDDGRAGGEHCAIFFESDRFAKLDEATFWLEEPSDQPCGVAALGTQTHLHLGPSARSPHRPHIPGLQHSPLSHRGEPPARGPADPGAPRSIRSRRAALARGRFQRYGEFPRAAGCLPWPG